MSAIDRRDRAGVQANVLRGKPTEIIVDTGVNNEWTLEQPALSWNRIRSPADTDFRIGYEMVFHPAPVAGNNKLLIYSHGHEGNAWDDIKGQSGATTDINKVKAVMQDGLDEYDIMQCWMFGWKEATSSTTDKFRNRPSQFSNLNGHNRTLVSLQDDLLKIFTWHYFGILNAIGNVLPSYSETYFAGFSGGGLMALWMGALEEPANAGGRLNGVYPMAGWGPDWVINSGDGEQDFGPQLNYTSRMGMAALANQKTISFWDSTDPVAGMTQANLDLTATTIQPVNPNYSGVLTTDADGLNNAHALRSAWLTTVRADMDAP